MSDAERDPHVLVSARLRANPKLIDLPSDRARWGWVVLLGEAKISRPAGRFASRRVLDHVLADHRRFVPDYLRVGLLHVAPDLCADCLARCPVAQVGEVVVHDWSKHQERVSRTTEWRRGAGLTSGHVSLVGETEGKRTGNTGGNNGETLARARASAGALQSQSQSENVEENDVEGGAGGRDPVMVYRTLIGRASPKVTAWIDDMATRYGALKTGNEIAAAVKDGEDTGKLLSIVESRLADTTRRSLRETRKARDGWLEEAARLAAQPSDPRPLSELIGPLSAKIAKAQA